MAAPTRTPRTGSMRTGVTWRPRVVVVAVLVAVLLPALRSRDSFPLSTYPMYANERDGIETLPAAVGVDARGERKRLSTGTIGRTDDPLIATSLLRNAIRGGRADALCAEIARRAPAGIVAVEVAEERIDLVEAASGDEGDEGVLDRTVRARCEVPR